MYAGKSASFVSYPSQWTEQLIPSTQLKDQLRRLMFISWKVVWKLKLGILSWIN